MLHIVICDDQPIIAEKIKNIIVSQMADTNEDYQLTAKYNGNDLLAFVSENQADLIFLDIDMPDISGLEIAEGCRDGYLYCKHIKPFSMDLYGQYWTAWDGPPEEGK